MTFADLGLSDELLRAVSDAGYSEPTPIQRQAIPPVLMNRDLIGIAQTGTGKTAAFVLPMIDVLSHGRARAMMPRSLILEPTRELAAQVAENFEKYGRHQKLSMALLIGGVSMGDQLKALEKGVDVLIATPGRLMDLFGRGKILLSGCSILVIDEADRMLDMGFIPDIEQICTKLPPVRQTLLFSATMPAPIKKLADRFLSNPKQIEVARPATANTAIEQAVVETSSRSKRETLARLLKADDVRTAIVFSNRKTTVRELTDTLRRQGFAAGQIHGDMEQPERLRELDRFKSGDINILVASDVAARGLDIKGVSHVFNYDVPWHPDDYVHRIGRTGRGGATGKAFTLMTPEDAEAIEAIEKLTGGPIPRAGGSAPAPAPATDAPPATDTAKPAARRRRGAGPADAPAAAAPKRGGAEDAATARPDAAPPSAPKRDAGAGTSKPAAPARKAPADDRPAAEPRRPAAAPAPASAVEVAIVDEPGADRWHGPVPAFLAHGFGTRAA
ncbi:MAG: DEAD/DEAH box helicase [Sphingomonas fennica]